MALERFVIEELGGLNRNLVDGLGKQPDELKNLKFDRMGGWRYYGRTNVVRASFASTPVYEMVNRYGTSYQTGSGSYSVHDAVANTLSTRALSKNLGAIGGGTSLANLNGSTNYFAIPRVRYGPYIHTITGLTVSPDQEASPVVPSVTLTWSNGGGTMEHNVFYTISYALYVETVGGKYVFTTSTILRDPSSDLGATSAGSFNFTNNSSYPLLIYIRKIGGTLADPETNGGLFAELPPTGTASCTKMDDLVASSDIFVEGKSNLTAPHQGRYYYVHPIPLGSNSATPGYSGPGYEVAAGPVWDIRREGLRGDNVVVYSEVVPSPQFANAVKALNFFTVSPEAGAGINALMSSPAGLLVFCENEIFLFRGDPASSPSLVRYSGTIGNTPGAHPVSLAGVIFNVWGGHVYMHSLGMGDVDFGQGIARISDDVYRVVDPFLTVHADQGNNQIIARTVSGMIYVYDAATQSWFEHAFSGDPSLYRPLNYGGGPLVEGIIFWDSGGSRLVSIQNRATALSAAPPHFRYINLDFGDKRAHKLFRSVEVFTNAEWSSATPPTMLYAVGGMASPVTVNAESLGSGRWVFRCLPGASGPRGTFKFTFPLMGADDVIEPPIVFNYVPKGRRRI